MLNCFLETLQYYSKFPKHIVEYLSYLITYQVPKVLLIDKNDNSCPKLSPQRTQTIVNF